MLIIREKAAKGLLSSSFGRWDNAKICTSRRSSLSSRLSFSKEKKEKNFSTFLFHGASLPCIDMWIGSTQSVAANQWNISSSLVLVTCACVRARVVCAPFVHRHTRKKSFKASCVSNSHFTVAKMALCSHDTVYNNKFERRWHRHPTTIYNIACEWMSHECCVGKLSKM